MIVYEDKGFGSSDKIDDATEDFLDAGDRPDVQKNGRYYLFIFSCISS